MHNINEQKQKLQNELAALEARQRNCKHTFGEPFYNAEEVMEGYGYKMEAHGSDVWGNFEGYRPVKKDRWTRECTLCGKQEHTHTLEPIVVGSKPKF